MWTRPVLCRLCECPASDGGVRVDQLDAAKLSEWWFRKIGTDFIPEESEMEEIICNFCIWDARYYYFVFTSAISCGYLIFLRLFQAGARVFCEGIQLAPRCQLVVGPRHQSVFPKILFSRYVLIHNL
jgi:hypothetical protein